MEDLTRAPGDLPYAIVLDPKGALYDAFGVGTGFGAGLHPRALAAALPNLVRTVFERRLGAPRMTRARKLCSASRQIS
jgi:hypothetical protein